ncbi:MAG TPA: IMP dehydrogenase [Lentisphaeria bacterium]|nr:MAG: IMP dehydrogenase [Lentisphaerae bacterium GWF2_38_69]HBM15868.1 IMP dehydrogenase [Lentisphaeria bacterium]
MGSFAKEGLTFDDVSLITAYADFLPEETEIKTKFSTNIELNIPFVSAAMDTVTESQMAIAMARLGGIGVIHKNLSVQLQAEEVRKVKNYLNGLIKKPVVFSQEDTVEHLIQEREEKKYGFSGFPIVNDEGIVLGIISGWDLKFVTNPKQKLKAIMSRKLITAPEDTPIAKAFDIMLKNKVGKLPLTTSKGTLVGLYSLTDVKSVIENINPLFTRDKEHRLRVAAAAGPYDYERIQTLIEAGCDAIVIDTAHGHSKGVIETVMQSKKNHPEIDIVAGNIGTEEGAAALLKAGADAVKVGIGPGSICTTRVVAGVGIPQISAIYTASKGVKNAIPIIGDGGIKQSGDVSKAIAAGAYTVMMGSALAGTTESPGEKISHKGKTYVIYRGMGSLEAMKSSQGSRERYGVKDADIDKLVPQGVEGMVLYRGKVEDVINQYSGGLKYSLGYCGTRTLSELRARAKFIKVTSAGLREAHPHDIEITKDAPNYSVEGY